MDSTAILHFAETVPAFAKCSPTIQAIVLEMASIVNSDDTTSDEVDAALATIEEALYPSPAITL